MTHIHKYTVWLDLVSIKDPTSAIKNTNIVAKCECGKALNKEEIEKIVNDAQSSATFETLAEAERALYAAAAKGSKWASDVLVTLHKHFEDLKKNV
mgnify:CR=1 FL=1